MKKQQLLSVLSAGLLTLGMAGSADAALVGRLPATTGGTDYQAYYDTVANLTWLADANYAATSGYATANAGGLGYNRINANGRMGWQAANAWAAQLTVSGVSGWRLPDTIDVGNDGATFTNFYQGVDYAYNITTHSELSNMFFNVLGNKSYYDTSGAQTGCTFPDYCLTNTGLFSNLQSSDYWSATEYAPDNITSAWFFSMSSGSQIRNVKNKMFYGWAVQSGDVSAVPVPAAAWLFGSGLLGLIGVARRKSTNL